MDKRIAEFEDRLKALADEFSDISPTFKAQATPGRHLYLFEIYNKVHANDPIMESLCRRVGFPANVVGMEFESSGTTFRVVDIKTRAPKYPVICLDTSTGARFKFAVHRVMGLLGGEKMIVRSKNLSSLSGDVI